MSTTRHCWWLRPFIAGSVMAIFVLVASTLSIKSGVTGLTERKTLRALLEAAFELEYYFSVYDATERAFPEAFGQRCIIDGKEIRIERLAGREEPFRGPAIGVWISSDRMSCVIRVRSREGVEIWYRLLKSRFRPQLT